jgi:hypothetical protein
MRKAFNFLLIPPVAASIAALSGCDAAPGKICVDPVTNVRTADDQCRRPTGAHGAGSPYIWYYLRSGAGAPPIGGNSRGMGSFTAESGVSYGTVSRGGFGATGEGFGAGA